MKGERRGKRSKDGRGKEVGGREERGSQKKGDEEMRLKKRREEERKGGQEEGCPTSCTLCLCPAAAAPCRALSSFTSNLRRTLTSVY